MLVDSLEVYSRNANEAHNVKIAIYSTDLATKKGESNAIAVPVSGDLAWLSGTPSGTITLVGGTDYAFAFSIPVAMDNCYWGYKTTTSGYCGYQSGDYVATSFPATLTLGTALAYEPMIRVGVSSSASIEQEGFRHRNDDGDEAGATWKANQDMNITLAADTAFRLRFLLKATGNPDSIDAQVEARVKPSGGAFGAWEKIN